MTIGFDDWLAITQLYAQYAAVVDAADWNRWPDLFTEDCVYRLQPRENHERNLPLATLSLTSRGMLLDRVYSIKETLFHDPYYQRHIISSPLIREAGTGQLGVRSELRRVPHQVVRRHHRVQRRTLARHDRAHRRRAPVRPARVHLRQRAHPELDHLPGLKSTTDSIPTQHQHTIRHPTEDIMRFGIFMAPFHPPAGQDPISAVQRDLEVVQLLDRLGYEEAWIGEHHSAGSEIIPDPMIFIAYAAPQTRHIKLGTGVLSLPYHNPLLVADRVHFLDQLLRGRFMLGLGPGALPGDAAMLGISIEEQRSALEQDTEVLMHLLRSDDPITIETPRYKLVNAKSQYGPYTDFDIAVAAIASPTGPRVAGQHGIGLLSIGATTTDGFDLLAHHWDVMEERAAQYGKVADRNQWRLVGPMHIAETASRRSRTAATGWTLGVSTRRRCWRCRTSAPRVTRSRSVSHGSTRPGSA